MTELDMVIRAVEWTLLDQQTKGAHIPLDGESALAHLLANLHEIRKREMP